MKARIKKHSIWSLITAALLVLSFGLVAVEPVSAGDPELSVDLGDAAGYTILAKSGISTTGTTFVTGDIGVSPIAASAITGFGLALVDPPGTYSISSLVSGKVYAADYTEPTPAYLGSAVLDMEAAYTDAAGRTSPDGTELYSGDLTGQTLMPGLYKWGTGVTVNSPGVTLSGSGVYIFQIAQNLTLGSGAKVTLANGADASNIFWQVGGGVGVEIGTTAHIEGNILAQAGINLRTGASLNGRALAQTAVTLDANAVTLPGATPPSTPTISFELTDITNPINVGETSDVTVTVMDGTIVKTDYVGTVAFTSTDENATLPGSYTFTTGDSGKKTFSEGVAFMNAGTQTVTAIDTDNSLINGTSEDIIVETKALTVTGITANNKIYDGNTSATLNTGAATLVGVIAGDDVTLNVSNATGTFDTKDVGTNKTVSISGLTLEGTDAGKYTLIQPSATADITAAPSVQYELKISSTSGGSVTTPGEGTHVRNAGTVVNLVAVADSGYQFVNWTGDTGTIGNKNTATTTITVNGNYNITANFRTIPTTTATTPPPTTAVKYNTTISSTSGGSVTTPGEGTFTNNKGAVVNLVAVADSGYQFVNWTGDTGTIGNRNTATTTITVNGNYNITANFKATAVTTSPPPTTTEQGPVVPTDAGYPWWFWPALALGILIALFFIFIVGRRREEDKQSTS